MNFHEHDSLYGLMFQVGKLHHQRMHILLEKLDIYPGQPPLLIALAHKDGQSQRELAEKICVKAATITVMLSRMEKSGLVERKQDIEDQRVSRVYITDKGREVFTEVSKVFLRIKEECFGNFTEEEKALLRRMFMQMRDNLTAVCDNKNV
jgi:MarR family transcriptional regulator, organic hydroperoxide resistance regulator